MLRRCLTVVCVLVVLLLAACARNEKDDVEFEPGALNPHTLELAARLAMFTFRSFDLEMPVARRPGVKFETLPYDDSLLVELRRRYDLKSVIEGAEDEWQAQLMLCHWLHEKIQNGTPGIEAGNAIEILDAAQTGHKFWCSYFAISYVQCALALGWQARQISLDHYHKPGGVGSRHHGAAEVWSNQWRKWVYIDPQSDLHFVHNETPLSAWEVRLNYFEGRADEVSHVVGLPPDTLCKDPAIVWWDLKDENELALFFWLIYHDSYSTWEKDSPSRFYTPYDDSTSGRTWYQGSGNSIHPHAGHELKLFEPIDDMRKLYYTVGVPEIYVPKIDRGKIYFSLDVFLPDFDHFEAELESGDWETVETPRQMVWDLHSGSNVLSIRAVNKAGVSGPKVTMMLR